MAVDAFSAGKKPQDGYASLIPCWMATRPLMLRETHLGTSASKDSCRYQIRRCRLGAPPSWRIGFVPSPQPAIAAILGSLGYGSTLANGRWHTKGPAQIVYAGSSPGPVPAGKARPLQRSQSCQSKPCTRELPARSEILHAADLGLPKDWHDHMAATQSIGMNWLVRGEPGSLGAVICRARP